MFNFGGWAASGGVAIGADGCVLVGADAATCGGWAASPGVATGTDGCVLNFLHLIDEFLAWKMKAIQKEVEARFYFSP